MKNIKLTAVSFRLILSVTLFLTAGIIVAAVWFSTSKLKGFAAEVSQISSDASASQDSVQTLQKTKQELEAQKDIVTKAANIVADSQGYQYQDQIIKDLNAYANASGLSITNFSFAASTGAASSATPAPAASGSTASPTPATTAIPSGVKSTTASVTLKTPVNYVNLLQFIHSIEQNLTKMQIARITLSKGASAQEINTDSLEIQVYIN